MWYFSWILGTLFACACGIINVMWLEAQQALDDAPSSAAAAPPDS